ncbi:MAG: ribosome-associated translation inhibitor RaiA [Propionibacteriaceae bacterium]|jgi:ribosomal subunit interface protein|nr:ribosome-associated translation inhibitor RaiA [Propionibacteriaceae bacterium]
MDVVVQGRHCQITENFRELVNDRLESLEKFVDRVIRAEVLASASEGRRQPDQAVRVEVTLIGKGPVVRAEAAADDKAIAFERAFDRLKSQLHKAGDRRRSYHNLRSMSAKAAAAPAAVGAPATAEPEPDRVPVRTMAGLEVQGDGPLVVREKHFQSAPLTLAQALDEMELVGHDFFLYVDQATGKPSVVYRRRAYDYGVIHLTVTQQ